jgi:hypothetical protein
MVQGASQFTPRQLLEAGRRAEAEGKLDLAQQFYGHLSDRYGHTSEATEGRNGLVRIGAFGAQPQVWQTSGTGVVGPALNGKAMIGRERERRVGYPAQSQDYKKYRIGRLLAALLSVAGWVTISGALVALAVTAAAEFAHVQALQPYHLGLAQMRQAAGALAGGVAALLVGQLARAVFDQASAAQQLVALERARTESEHP